MARRPPSAIVGFDVGAGYRYGSFACSWPLDFGLRMSGIEYSSVTHAYQAAKTLDPDARRRIAAAPTPAEAIALGRRVARRHDWPGLHLEVMQTLVEEKFARDRWLRGILLATEGRMLIAESTDGDRYWGTVNRTGENLLGCILMEVRDRLRKAES